MSEQSMQDTAIGPLPSDWNVVKLGAVSSEGTERNRALDFGRADVLGVDNRTGLGPSDRLLGEDFSRYKLVRNNQFAYNPMRLNVGSIGLWREDQTGIVSPDYIVFGCDEDRLDADFLDLFRDSAGWEIQIRQSGQGSVRIRYYYRHIAGFSVPLPPLPEQRAIAHVLRTVQRTKEVTAKVIAAARQLKQSLMRHLFTYGPVPFDRADRVRLKETEIGELPEHWRLRSLGELIASGPQNGLYKPEQAYGRGTPIIRIDDFSNEGDIVTSAPTRVELDRSEIARYSLREGDILVNRVNSLTHLGKAALVGRLGEPIAFESNMMRFGLAPDLAFSPYVFRYLTSPPCRNRLRGVAKRAVAQSSVNQGDVKALPLPLPSLSEQAQIASMIDVVDRKARSELDRKNALATLFQSLLHHLMTGKVRVHNIPAFTTPAEPAPA